jgi:ketosteroid isomerase-like protein
VSDSGAATAAVVRKAYDAVERGDIEGLFVLIAPDAVWRVPGRSPVAGAHRGHAEIGRFLAGLRERCGGTLRVRLDDIAVGDESAVALQRVTAERNARTLDLTMCVVYRASGGLLVEARYFVEDQAAYDAFWS